MSRIYGWDASHYDWDRGPMDMARAVREGIAFATHKIGEGGSYTDPRFDDWYRKARAARVPLLGAYFVNHRGDQRAQADRFLALLNKLAPGWDDGPFILQVDAERWSNATGVYAYEPRPAEVRAFCDRLVERTGGRYRPLVYAPKWVYADSLKGLPYPLWASSYGTNPVKAFADAYPGDDSSRWGAYSGQTPAVLQYGSKTRIAGQGTCDANAFRGTLAQLAALVYPKQQTLEEDDMTPAEFAAILRDPTVGALMRAMPWQYVGGGMPGVPAGKSALWTLGTAYSQTKEALAKLDALAAAVGGLVAEDLDGDMAALTARFAEERQAWEAQLAELGQAVDEVPEEVAAALGHKPAGEVAAALVAAGQDPAELAAALSALANQAAAA